MRILIADDHVDSGDALALLLCFLGYNDVRVARGGREALAVAREYWPDVAFLDLDMPDLHGADVARALWQQPAPTRPVLVCYSALPPSDGHKELFDFELVKTQPLDAIEAVLQRCAALLAGAAKQPFVP